MSTCAVHDWCTRKHQDGSNPRRQEHEHVYAPATTGSTETLKVNCYPVPQASFPPAMMMRIRGTYRYGDLVLSLEDLRDLIADLSRMADVLEAEQALLDAKTVYTEAGQA